MSALLDAVRHRISVDDYHRMGELGIFADARVELIEGAVYDMAPIGPRHADLVRALNRILTAALGDTAWVDVQNPIHLGPDSEPQPDIAVIAGGERRYRDRHPAADDVLLVIEVCDTTLAMDRDVKVPMYARHGIRELWLIDVNERWLEIRREPQPAHRDYRLVERIHEGTATAGSLAGLQVDLAELFGA